MDAADMSAPIADGSGHGGISHFGRVQYHIGKGGQQSGDVDGEHGCRRRQQQQWGDGGMLTGELQPLLQPSDG